MPVGIEGIGAIDTAHEPLARSTVADVEEHAVFDSMPEEGDFDPVALAERKLAQPLGCLREHGLQADVPGAAALARQRESSGALARLFARCC